MPSSPRPVPHHNHAVRQLQDGETGVGSVSTVNRSGSTVRRPCGPWTPTVHALLRHLAAKGYHYSPRVIGLEAEGETLEYLEGEVALRPWPSCLLEDSGIAAIGVAICEYHEAVADFVPPPSAVWRDPEKKWKPGMIVRHGDLGPWNMVWKEGRLAGIIDWDMAEPGDRIDDIAQIAWYGVPLRPPLTCLEAGIQPGPAQPRRLSILCDVCKVGRSEVIAALKRLLAAEADRTERLGSQGIKPWATFRRRGDVYSIDHEAAWLHEWAVG